MASEQKERAVFLLPADLLARFRRLARREGRRYSAELERAIRRHLAEDRLASKSTEQEPSATAVAG